MIGPDLSHLDALLIRLSREIGRRDTARTKNERAFREREICACQREISAEYKFLAELTDDELLAELMPL